MLSSTSFFVLVDAEEIELHLSPREQIQIDLLTFLCYIGVFLNCFELIVQRKIIVTLDFCLFLTFLKTAGSRYGSASFRLSAKAVQSLHFAMWPCLETDHFKSSKKRVSQFTEMCLHGMPTSCKLELDKEVFWICCSKINFGTWNLIC